MTEAISKVLKGLSTSVLKEIAKQALHLMSDDDARSVVYEWRQKNDKEEVEPAEQEIE